MTHDHGFKNRTFNRSSKNRKIWEPDTFSVLWQFRLLKPCPWVILLPHPKDVLTVFASSHNPCTSLEEIKREETYPWQSSTSWGTRSESLRPMIAVEVVETAWDVTILSDFSLFIEALVLSNLVSSSPLYSWLWRADNFFSHSIFTPSLA